MTQTTQPSTGGGIFGWADGLGKALAFLTNSGNWARIGIFALGATLLLIAAVKLLADTDAGQTVIQTTKTAAKTAAEAATVAA